MTSTPRLGMYHPIRVPKSLTQPNISAVNIDESSSMSSEKVMDSVEASLAALLLSPEVGINQVDESYKVRKSISW